MAPAKRKRNLLENSRCPPLHHCPKRPKLEASPVGCAIKHTPTQQRVKPTGAVKPLTSTPAERSSSHLPIYPNQYSRQWGSDHLSHEPAKDSPLDFTLNPRPDIEALTSPRQCAIRQCDCCWGCHSSGSADEELQAILSVENWRHEDQSDQNFTVVFAGVQEPASHDNIKAGGLAATAARQAPIHGLRASPSVNSCISGSCPGSPTTNLQPQRMTMATSSRNAGGDTPLPLYHSVSNPDDEEGGFVASLLMDSPDGWEPAASPEPSSAHSLLPAHVSQCTSSPACKPYRPGGWTAFLMEPLVLPCGTISPGLPPSALPAPLLPAPPLLAPMPPIANELVPCGSAFPQPLHGAQMTACAGMERQSTPIHSPTVPRPVHSPPAVKSHVPITSRASESLGLSDSEDAAPDQYCPCCVSISGSPGSAMRFLRLPSPEELRSGRHQAEGPMVPHTWSMSADAPCFVPMRECKSAQFYQGSTLAVAKVYKEPGALDAQLEPEKRYETIAPYCWPESPPLGTDAASMVSPLHSAIPNPAVASPGVKAGVSRPETLKRGAMRRLHFSGLGSSAPSPGPETSATDISERGGNTEHSAGKGAGSEESALGKGNSPGRVRLVKLEVPREAWANMASPVEVSRPSASTALPPSPLSPPVHHSSGSSESSPNSNTAMDECHVCSYCSSLEPEPLVLEPAISQGTFESPRQAARDSADEEPVPFGVDRCSVERGSGATVHLPGARAAAQKGLRMLRKALQADRKKKVPASAWQKLRDDMRRSVQAH